MNFAKRLPLIVLALLGACATKPVILTNCGQGSELLTEIDKAKSERDFQLIQNELTDQSDIYLLYYFHKRRAELESKTELASAYSEYADEIWAHYPVLKSCEVAR